MDAETLKHLDTWLARTVSGDDEREKLRYRIVAYVTTYPEGVDYGWPTIRSVLGIMASSNYVRYGLPHTANA
jgi:hypothetical protein